MRAGGFRYAARQTLLMQPGSLWGWNMRNAMSTRWIEEAEARRVLTDTLAEGQPTPPHYGLAENALHLSTRLLSWLTTRWAILKLAQEMFDGTARRTGCQTPN